MNHSNVSLHGAVVSLSRHRGGGSGEKCIEYAEARGFLSLVERETVRLRGFSCVRCLEVGSVGGGPQSRNDADDSRGRTDVNHQRVPGRTEGSLLFEKRTQNHAVIINVTENDIGSWMNSPECKSCLWRNDRRPRPTMRDNSKPTTTT